MRSSPLAQQATVDVDATALKVVRQLSAKIGIECFRALTTHLAQALKADCVFVGEFTSGSVERVTTLAAYLEGEQGSLAFDLAGSACSIIAVTGKPYICRRNARNRFPSDQMLRTVHAEACSAVSLPHSAGMPISVIMATVLVP